MYKKCHECNFNVSNSEKHCLNCGTYLQKVFNTKQTLIIFIILLLLSFPFAIFSISFDIFAAFMTIFVISFITLLIQAMIVGLSGDNSDSNCFINKESVINERLEELGNRSRSLNNVLEQINESDTEQLQNVKRKLLSANEIITNHFNRYDLQKMKINLIRIQNKVSPILSNFQHLNEAEITKSLKTLDEANNLLMSYRTGISNNVPSDLSINKLPERDTFLEQIVETEHSYSKLRESLISKQATNALSEIGDFGINSPENYDLSLVVETFNANTELTEFSESFEKLEKEYKRLQTEADINEKLLS